MINYEDEASCFVVSAVFFVYRRPICAPISSY